jgi:hypothetical protein
MADFKYSHFMAWICSIYVPSVFSNQFDLNIFMKTTENSSIFRLLTNESMLFNIGNILNRKEVVKEIPPYLEWE